MLGPGAVQLLMRLSWISTTASLLDKLLDLVQGTHWLDPLACEHCCFMLHPSPMCSTSIAPSPAWRDHNFCGIDELVGFSDGQVGIVHSAFISTKMVDFKGYLM